jgi:hypothetical protein
LYVSSTKTGKEKGEKVEVNEGKTEVGREGGAKGKFIRTSDDRTAHTAPILGAV